jgi:hypothetical protein
MELRAFSGLRNDRPVERFEPGDLSVAQNIDIDNSGAISLRTGYALRSAGAKHSLWSSDDDALALYVSGTTLVRLNADMSGTVLMTGLTVGLPMAYWKTLDRVYFTNGKQSGVLDNGAVRSWGLTAPAAPAVSVTVGTVPAGTYQYTMTYFRNDGQESGAALAGAITVPEGSGLIFVMPVSSDPTVTLKAVYLSTPNSEVMYQAVVLPNATTSTTYSESTAELNLPLVTQFLAPPPAGQIVRDYRGVMYVASGDALYPSEEYAYEMFDYRRAIPLDGRVTLIEALDDRGGGGLFVGTNRTCGALAGKGIADFEYVPKVNYGAIEGTSVRVDGSLFGDDSAGARLLPVWLTAQGACVGLPQMEVRNLTRTRYRIAASGRGAGVFLPTSNRLILTAAL